MNFSRFRINKTRIFAGMGIYRQTRPILPYFIAIPVASLKTNRGSPSCLLVWLAEKPHICSHSTLTHIAFSSESFWVQFHDLKSCPTRILVSSTMWIHATMLCCLALRFWCSLPVFHQRQTLLSSRDSVLDMWWQAATKLKISIEGWLYTHFKR